MSSVISKALGVWLIMMVAAILNGLLRDAVLVALLGTGLALPLSGITLALLVFAITFFLLPLIGAGAGAGYRYILIGLLWVVLTLAFEVLFGYFVLGMPWSDISQVFNPATGDLFMAVLLSAALSPWLVAKIRHLL